MVRNPHPQDRLLILTLGKGRDTPGIFRIPGQTGIINQLYNHYKLQGYDAEREGSDLEAIVGSAQLPGDIPCGTHDAASTFKKFLWDMPGGILGSLALFKALREVQAVQPSASLSSVETHILKARMIALAILSLRSSRRVAVLSAVLGLLAWLKDDRQYSDPDRQDSTTPTRQRDPETMSSKALAVVFAPVLLGDLTEKIAISSDLTTTPSTAETPKRGFMGQLKTPRHTKASSMERTPEINCGIERNNAAAMVIEMLLRNWERTVRYINIYEKTWTDVRDTPNRVGRSSLVFPREAPLANCVVDPTVSSLSLDVEPSQSGRIQNPFLQQRSGSDPEAFYGETPNDTNADSTSSSSHIKLPSIRRSASLRLPNLETPYFAGHSELRETSHDGGCARSTNSPTVDKEDGKPALREPAQHRLVHTLLHNGSHAAWWERLPQSQMKLRHPLSKAESLGTKKGVASTHSYSRRTLDGSSSDAEASVPSLSRFAHCTAFPLSEPHATAQNPFNESHVPDPADPALSESVSARACSGSVVVSDSPRLTLGCPFSSQNSHFSDRSLASMERNGSNSFFVNGHRGTLQPRINVSTHVSGSHVDETCIENGKHAGSNGLATSGRFLGSNVAARILGETPRSAPATLEKTVIDRPSGHHSPSRIPRPTGGRSPRRDLTPLSAPPGRNGQGHPSRIARHGEHRPLPFLVKHIFCVTLVP